MNRKLVRLVAPIVLIAFFQLGCYAKYRISISELEELQSGSMQETVTVNSDAGPVVVRGTTPIEVHTTTGVRHSVTPFNFSVTDTQLVAPDYNLLIVRDNLDHARVSEFKRGRTVALIVGSVLLAGGGFALMSILAGNESEPAL